MTRLLRALCATTALVSAAHAASPTTRSSLQTYTDQTFTTNGQQKVTGAELNAGLSALIASAGILTDTNAWTGANTFAGPTTFTGTVSFVAGSIAAAALASGAAASNLGFSPIAHVATRAALTLTAAAIGTVMRDGYATAGDGGGAVYTWSASSCSLNSGAGDNGAQVQAAAGGCWNILPSTSYDFRIWGAVPNSTSADNGPQLRAAAAWSASAGATITFPPANYWCNSTDAYNLGCIYVGPSTNTTTTQGQSGGDTTITVASAASFTNGANIGVQLTNGGIFHAIVSGAPAGNVITLDRALPSGLPNGAKVFWYDTANPTKAFKFAGPGPVVNVTSCGVTSPMIVLGSGVNRPLVNVQQNSASPTWFGMCWHGKKSLQSGWTGGPIGGKLFAIQADDGTDYTNEGSFSTSYSAVLQGYDGGTYEGAFRGIFYSLFDFWLQNGSNAGSGAGVYMNGGDSVIVSPGIGNTIGYGIYYNEGAQHKLTGAGSIWYGKNAAIYVNGNAVGTLNVDGMTLQRNIGGCIIDNNSAPQSGHNAGAHIFVNMIFDACNYTDAAALHYSDVNVGAGNDSVQLIAPAFIGSAITGDPLPDYHVNSGGGVVTMVNPSFGSLGVAGSSSLGFTNDCAKVVGTTNTVCGSPQQLPTWTVATLPTCNSARAGQVAYVTDATAPTYNTALTGGGAVKTLAACNGAAWTAH